MSENTRLAEMERENARLRAQVAQLEADKADLDKRLEAVFRMDEIAKNQELETLKVNLSRFIAPEYDDYHTPGAEDFDMDNFEAARSSLWRIFKVLKRYGIRLD